MKYIDCFDFVVFNVDRVMSRMESQLFTRNRLTCVWSSQVQKDCEHMCN